MRFGQSLIQGLINPGYSQGLFSGAQAMGQRMAGVPTEQEQAEIERVRLENQQKEQSQGMLSLAAMAQQGAQPESLAAMQQSLAARTGASADQLLSATQVGTDQLQQQQAKDKRQKAIDSIVAIAQERDLSNPNVRSAINAVALRGGLSPQETQAIIGEAKDKRPALTVSEITSLYDNFEPSTVQAYEQTRNPNVLKPLNAKQKEKQSTYATQLEEAGYAKGTPEFQQMMRRHIDVEFNKANAPSMPPIEQAELLVSELRKDPLWEANQSRIEKLRNVDSLKAQVAAGDSNAIRLLERTVSELYNSDSRAASEIERLLQGKGISRSFSDWVATAIAGDVSKETKDILMAIAENARKNALETQQNAVDFVVKQYEPYVSQPVLENFKKSSGGETNKPVRKRYNPATGQIEVIQ